MFLTDERRASLLAYCKLTEFGDDQEVLALLETFYSAAVGYMAQAGVSLPPEGTARRAQYDLCVNHIVCDSWDNREISYVSTVVADNPVFRRIMNQLKRTEPAKPRCAGLWASGPPEAGPQRNVSKLDTTPGEEA